MGVYSTQLYKLLPQHARFLDDRGILRHFCDAIQPEIDQLYGIVRNQARYYDPQLTDDRFLDFLQQFVGGAIRDGKWLGIGLDPDWPGYYKRQVIPELWQYWQLKGTERGVRQAINLWLRLEQAKTSKVYIRLPLSKFPTEAPNSWFSWGDCYDSHLFQDYEDRLFFGAGDAPGVEYRPDYYTVRNTSWLWEWGDIVPEGVGVLAPTPSTTKLAKWDAPPPSASTEPYPVDFGISWSDRTLSSFLAPLINDEASHLGARRPWQHLFLNEFDWNKTFPNVLELNPEIYPALAVPTTFGWLEDIRHIKPLILIEHKDAPQYRFSTEIEIDGMQYGILDTVGATPGSIKGSSLYEPAPPSYAKNYPDYDPIYEAGDWWPFPVIDPYYTTEYEEIKAEFGVWIPDYWDGMWWASAITSSQQGILVSELKTPFFGFVESDGNEYLSAMVMFEPPLTLEQRTNLSYQLAELTTKDIYPSSGYQAGSVEEGEYFTAVVTPIISGLSDGSYQIAEVTEGELFPLSSYQPGLITEGSVVASYQGFAPAIVSFQYPPEPIYELAEVDEGDDYPAIDYQSGLVISDEIYALPIIDVFPIDLSDFQLADSLNRPPGEEWYLPWGTYIDRHKIEVFHPGSGCNPGIEIELDVDEIPVIDLGGYLEGANQLLFDNPPQLEPPVKIAEYISPLDDGWEYYRQPVPDLGAIYKNVPPPIDISAIDMDIELELPAIDRERVQLCNVFKRWSTGEILRWEEYKEEIPQSERDLFEIYPMLARASSLDNWQAVVETSDEIYLLRPTTAFWRNTETVRGEEEYFLSEHLGRKFYGKTRLGYAYASRSQSFSFEEEMTNLHLEFVFRPKRGEVVRSLTLWLDGQQVHSQFFYDSLNFPVEACYGFKFFLPFTLPTGATNPDDNLAILDILPGLRDRLVKLQKLIPAEVVSQELLEEIETVYEQPVTIDGLRTTMTQIQGTLDRLLASPNLGDLHHTEIIKSPTLQVTVRHGLGKEPSVTFMSDDGFDAEIDVWRSLDANTVRVLFTKPAQGRLFFN